MEGKKIALTITNIALLIVTAFMSLMTTIWVYYKTVGKDKIPSAVTSTYATYITDPATNEQKPVIEANYYSNYNKTGYQVIELLFNCYSGISKQAIYCRGFQLVYDNNGRVIPYVYNGKSENVFQYNKYDDVSFETGHQYNWGDKMIIDIDGTTYAVALDGKYSIHHKNFNLGGTIKNSVVNTFTLHWGKDPVAYDEWDETFQYTFEDLLIKMAQIIKSSSQGTGNSVISLIDLGDFLHIYAINDDGQISGQPLGVNTLQNSYFTMSVHYDRRGMVWAKQSIFDSVAGDSAFNISGISEGVDYWKATVNHVITESDFEKRYVTSEDGYYYTLKSNVLTEIKNFENLLINVEFNISNLQDNVLGLDYYSLYGLKINSLTIKSDVQQDFVLMTNSLKDTGLESIETENVRIININSGVVV